ncbi:lysosome-associated membrane glycoprotein 1 isoform X2 [Microcaecilia unicolor]|uniref:Lysosome-associated membrane glycoprotein 1 n=1 Tax=Microcaecilia unicolor TaxID=1415580 RepID=A0A6P7XWN6_9AMPH|nr:lysosome-associated membrane glycoprotein 1 isoform X2 [Microcaecilia unicolor]
MVTTSGWCLFSRATFPVLLLPLFLACLQPASSVQFDVRDEKNESCILADLAVNFSVTYDAGNTSRLARFELPKETRLLNSSSCGKENVSDPLLEIGFEAGHKMKISFTKNSSKYRVDELTFTYNLSDALLFPNASEKGGPKVVTSQKTGIEADMNTTYRCINQNIIHMGNVNATFYNIKIQAYPTTSNFSVKETPCSEDVTPTTVPATTLPPPVPAPTSAPKSGKYQVNGTNYTCILADMGLQLNITYLNVIKTNVLLFNVDPQNVTVSGNCTVTSAILTLTFEKTSLTFMFRKNDTTHKFYLGGVDVNTTLPPDAKVPAYKAANESIMYLQTTLGKSYMCKTMQVLNITDTFSVNVFNVQVQAFNIDGNNFGTEEECRMDEDSILVPIIVGAALAGLVLIVLIAYLIGRKRSHAGYQTI